MIDLVALVADTDAEWTFRTLLERRTGAMGCNAGLAWRRRVMEIRKREIRVFCVSLTLRYNSSISDF